MKNPICISTGCVYKLSEDMNKKIKLLRQFSADGIELNFASPVDLNNFRITQDNLGYLRNKRTTIHAPWIGINYGENYNCRDTLNSAQRLYDKTNAVLVTLHKKPGDDLSVLKDYSFFPAIENDDWRKDLTSVRQLREILEQNPDLGFTFDFAHSLLVSPELTEEFLASLRNKMSQVHMSYLDRTASQHAFLHKHDAPTIRKLISRLPENMPLVLEAVASNTADLPLIRDEIDYLRGIVS